MAIIQYGNRAFTPALENILPAAPEEVDGPSAGETIAAAFRQENLLGSLIARQDFGSGEIDAAYNWKEGVIGTPYEAHLDRFAVGTFNRHQQQAMMRQIDMEEDDRRTLANAGWAGTLASIGAGTLSPENLLPFGSVYRSVRIGQAVGRTALSTGAAAVLGAGVSEIGLHATQELRTVEESAFALGGAAIIGSVFGAGAGALFSRADMAKYAKAIEADINAGKFPGVTAAEAKLEFGKGAITTPDGIMHADRILAVTPANLEQLKALVPDLTSAGVREWAAKQGYDAISIRGFGGNADFSIGTGGKLEYVTKQLEAEVTEILDRIIPQRSRDYPVTSAVLNNQVSARDFEAHGMKPGDPNAHVAGMTTGQAARTVVQIAWRLPNAAEMFPHVARHESIHALRRMGLFTRDEWKALEDAVETYGWRDATGKTTNEEAIAEAFASWGLKASKGEQALKIDSYISKIFQKIADFYIRLKESMSGAGRERWEQIFADIETGAVGRRDIGKASGGFISKRNLSVVREFDWRDQDIVLAPDRLRAPPATRDPQAAMEAEMGQVMASAAQSGGAAAVARDTLDDLSIAGKAAGTVGQRAGIWRLNPILRAMHSPSRALREFATSAMEFPIYLKKNMEGRATEAAVETLVKEFTQGRLSTAVKGTREAYGEFRANGGTLTLPQFNEAVGKAMRRADTDPNPQVAKAAQLWRREMFDPLKEKAIEAKLLPPDVTVETAASYFSRVYNKRKIELNEAAFKGVVTRWLNGEYDKAVQTAGRKSDKAKTNVLSEIQDREMRVARRAEETRRRADGGEVDVELGDEANIMSMVRQVREGKRPPAPERLSEWIKRQVKDGVYDPGGDLVQVFPELRKMPGMMRKTFKTTTNTKGGIGLDDLAQRAWDEGFLNIGEDARPTPRALLDLLDEDIRGSRVVRANDIEAARLADDFDQIEEALSRMGVDLDKPLLGTSESMKDLAAKVNRVLDEFDAQEVAKLKAKVDKLEQKLVDEFPEFVSKADRDDYIKGIADNIFNTITGRNADGDMPRDIVAAKRGPLKERTFNIPDEMIEEFLESDVDLVGRRYARTMSADIELKNKFGDTTLDGKLKEVRQEYADLRQAVEGDETLSASAKDKRLRSLLADEKSDIADMQAVRDMLRGTYKARENESNFGRVTRVAGTLNYVRAMGGVVLASLTDVARHVMVHGLTNVMRDGLVPLITNLKSFKMSVEEARIAGAISERILNTRMATLAELNDPYSMSSPFERFMDNTARGFSKWNGMVYWNDFQKSFASVLTQNRVLRGAADYGKIKPKEKAYLAFLGIDDDMAARIAKEFDAHGSIEAGGVRVANSDNWTDDLARRAYRAAVNKDVDSTIITKGIGDVPLFAHTPIGRMFLQFKGFALASHQRAFMRGLQEGPAGFVSGTLMATTIGMMIYYLKSVEANRQEDISDNPGRWIAEGLDRSGMFAVAFEANNTIEKTFGIGAYAALAAAFPDADQNGKASRYMARSTAAAILGPTGDFIDTLVRAVNGIRKETGEMTGASEKGMTKGDVNSLFRLAPFATLPVIRSAVEYYLKPAATEAIVN